MSGVSLYVVESSRIVFRRDGCWYANGERVTNRRIATLLSRHLVQFPDGTYAIVMGNEEAPVEIEDMPWVVTQVDGDRDTGFVVTLNDESSEPLDPASLDIGSDNAFSCSVKGGTARARFLRSAHHSFACHVDATDQSGQFVIWVEGQRYPLATPKSR